MKTLTRTKKLVSKELSEYINNEYSRSSTLMNPKPSCMLSNWDIVSHGGKIKAGDKALHYGAWVPVETLNWVGEILSNPHTWIIRKK